MRYFWLVYFILISWIVGAKALIDIIGAGL